jgi:hypothetical protein
VPRIPHLTKKYAFFVVPNVWRLVFLAYFILLIASVAYAIGASVNTSRALN